MAKITTCSLIPCTNYSRETVCPTYCGVCSGRHRRAVKWGVRRKVWGRFVWGDANVFTDTMYQLQQRDGMPKVLRGLLR